MAGSISVNRLRHVLRRMREVPLTLLVRKAAIIVRHFRCWPEYALRRAGRGAQRRGAMHARFERFAEALRAEVRRAAHEDAVYASALRSRLVHVESDRRFPCLGFGSLPLPRGEAWRTDVTSGYRWPDRYFPFVNFLTHGADADVKVPWELARLQWLVWLAEGAVAATDAELRDRCTRAVVDGIADFGHSNPVGYGPNWTVAMEVGIRALNLSLAAALVWDRLEPARRAAIADLLGEHLRYLRRFPELSDKLGNHFLVGFGAVVFLERVVLAEPLASRAPMAEITARLEEQFGADGLHVEHAPLYHRLCVESLLWTLAAIARADGSVPVRLTAVADRAWWALERLELREDGLPVIGDADSGQLVALGAVDRRVDYLRRLLGLRRGGAALLRATAGGRALLGTADSTASPSPVERMGPFLRFGAERLDVVVRAGPHGLFGRASHDHDDNAAPWVAIDGRDFLVDGGCIGYTRSLADRLTDVGSGAHNLITVDGRLRFVLRAGAMSPTVAAAPVAIWCDSTPSIDTPEVRLRLSWRDPVAGAVDHDRRFVVIGGSAPSLTVEDVLGLERGAPLVLRWLVAPRWRVSVRGSEVVATSADPALTVRITFGVDGGTFDGAPVATTERFSPRYGERTSLTAITVRVAAAQTIRLTSRFVLTSSAA